MDYMPSINLGAGFIAISKTALGPRRLKPNNLMGERETTADNDNARYIPVTKC